MKIDFSSKIAASLMLGFFAFGCVAFVNGDGAVEKNIKSTKQVENLFFGAKLLCFGRYAMYVPKDSDLIWGVTSFPSDVNVVNGSAMSIQEYMDKDISEIIRKNDTAEVIFSGPSRLGVGWQLNYYEDKYAKRDEVLFSRGYIKLDDNVFLLSAAKNQGESEDAFAIRQLRRANSLRLRNSNDVPASPGYCIERGFMANDMYEVQEIVAIGLHLPSFPDVKFSVSSNKNAYADYPSAEFDGRLRGELSLLSRIKQAKEKQGANYPRRVVLREGIRHVQHWKGEESLIRRADGTHDFEWAFVGRPKDVANPSEFNIRMFTKVAHNMIGAAEKSSLTDEEAVALWDKFLSGFKFRVKVPDAPKGSYYFLPGDTTDSGAKP
jgi:hypothetical protein